MDVEHASGGAAAAAGFWDEHATRYAGQERLGARAIEAALRLANRRPQDRLVDLGTGSRRRCQATVMPRRKPRNPASQVVNDRAWSARRSVDSRDVGKDLARYAPLPAETGPTWAPDQLSIWPVEGGRYGIDAHYYGATGEQRAGHQVTRLHQAGLDASIRVAGLNDGATLRLGPFDHEAAWLALRAFLGRPMGMPA